MALKAFEHVGNRERLDFFGTVYWWCQSVWHSVAIEGVHGHFENLMLGLEEGLSDGLSGVLSEANRI